MHSEWWFNSCCVWCPRLSNEKWKEVKKDYILHKPNLTGKNIYNIMMAFASQASFAQCGKKKDEANGYTKIDYKHYVFLHAKMLVSSKKKKVNTKQ